MTPQSFTLAAGATLWVEGPRGAQLDGLSSSRVKLTEAILLYEYIYLSDARKAVFGFQKSLIMSVRTLTTLWWPVRGGLMKHSC